MYTVRTWTVILSILSLRQGCQTVCQNSGMNERTRNNPRFTRVVSYPDLILKLLAKLHLSQQGTERWRDTKASEKVCEHLEPSQLGSWRELSNIRSRTQTKAFFSKRNWKGRGRTCHKIFFECNKKKQLHVSNTLKSMKQWPRVLTLEEKVHGDEVSLTFLIIHVAWRKGSEWNYMGISHNTTVLLMDRMIIFKNNFRVDYQLPE